MATATQNQGTVGDFSNSFIAKGTVVRGKVESQGDMRVDGKIEGTINCKGKIIMGSESTIDSNIEVGEMNINGKFTGDIDAKQQIKIGELGRVKGNLTTPILEVANGAILNSKITMPEKGK